MDSNDRRFAVLIDADNASHNYIPAVLGRIAVEGKATLRRAYGDWSRSNMNGWSKVLLDNSIQPIQQFAYTTGKNATDTTLIIDAMDLLYTNNFDGFCIVSSDSDFTRLAQRLRESGLLVYGFGEDKTPDPLRRACNQFFLLEILLNPADEAGDQEEPTPLDSDSTSSIVTGEKPTTLRNKNKIMRLAVDAVAVEDDDYWAPLSTIGSYLLRVDPNFDTKNYGYNKLKDMFEDHQAYEVKLRPRNGVTAKSVCVRRRPSAGKPPRKSPAKNI